MTEFTAIAIVPKELFENDEATTERVVHGFIAKNMAPYDEALKVEPYETVCLCIGEEARTEARQVAEKELDFESIRNSLMNEQKKFNKAVKDERKRIYGMEEQQLAEKIIEQQNLIVKNQEFMKKYGQEYTARAKIYRETLEALGKLEKKYFDSHPRKNLHSENCKYCKGTGKRMSDYNPNSKWDWYSVGQRGDLKLKIVGEAAYDIDQELSVNYNRVKPNSTKLKNLLEDVKRNPELIPYVIITKDGKWLAKGNLGWWGISTDEMEDWPKQFVKILEEQDLEDYGVWLHGHI